MEFGVLTCQYNPANSQTLNDLQNWNFLFNTLIINLKYIKCGSF